MARSDLLNFTHTPMPEPRKADWTIVAAVVLLLVVVVLPALYVLSIGPAEVLVNKGYLSTATAQTIYYPILIFCQRNDAIGELMESYVSLWTST